MQLISKNTKRVRFLLCVMNIYSKYVQVCLKKKNLDESGRKPTKTWEG